MSTKEIFHTVEEAATYLGLRPTTLNCWRVAGKGPRFVKFGRAVRYRDVDLQSYIKRSLRKSTSDPGLSVVE